MAATAEAPKPASPPPVPSTVSVTGAPAGKSSNIVVFIIIGVVILTVVGMGIFFAVRSLTGNTTNNAVEDETTIELDKDEYEQGEAIEVDYLVVETLHDGAWIGIMDADTDHNDEEEADSADVSWQYLYGDEDATITMYAPWDDGEYDIRIYDSDETDAEELISVTFNVVSDESTPTLGENWLSLAYSSYNPGDDIPVLYGTDGTLSDWAWIGIVPSDVEHGSESVNDTNDVDYEWITDDYGTVTLTAPDELGEYDVRMSDGDQELTYESFEVIRIIE